MKYDQTIEYPKAKNIVVSGDIHGDFTKLVHKCCVLYGMRDTLIHISIDVTDAKQCAVPKEKYRINKYDIGCTESVYIKSK